MIKISVVICTHNRMDVLTSAIESIINQTLDHSLYEIIVVDNASTDDTKKVCGRFTTIKNFRYVFESESGLSVARNAGTRTALGKYVAFIDDDAVASPQWLELILKGFETVRPVPDSVGGKIFPRWESPKPEWFPDVKGTYFTILDYGDVPKFLRYPDILFGTNMTYRKSVLMDLGGFKSDVGRKKKRLLSGEEADIYKKFSDRGLLVYYQPEASVHHLVPKERISKRWLCKRHYWQARSEVLVHGDSFDRVNIRGVLGDSFRKLRSLATYAFVDFAGKNDPTANFFFYATVCEQFGKIVGMLNNTLFGNERTHTTELLHDIKVKIDATFEGMIQFVGYTMDDAQVNSGEDFKIVYYWKCLKPVEKDFTTFIHFHDGSSIQFQNDHLLKTSRWGTDKIVADVHVLQAPREIRKTLNILVGIWLPLENIRLSINNAGTAVADTSNRLNIGQLIIR